MGFADDKEFTPHMLRHTCTTRLIARGESPAIVQKWMGHSQAKMTEHYTQLGVEDMRGGAKILDTYYNNLYDEKPSHEMF
jgi:integrase